MPPAAIDLYWLPLGAGGRSVRFNGQVYEAVCARLQHRPPCDLYHSALSVTIGPELHVIEMAPAWNAPAPERGVVAEGAVGTGLLGRLRVFRYEIRCWCDGAIPDADEAVDSPQRLSEDQATAQHILELIPRMPTPVWGRDELGIGDMFNSNSVISWLLTSSGIDACLLHPPNGGRAPGWATGLALARRP